MDKQQGKTMASISTGTGWAETGASPVFKIIEPPKQSKWRCYLWGSHRDKDNGYMVYIPTEGHEPNWLARWMMRICFDCRWVREP